MNRHDAYIRLEPEGVRTPVVLDSPHSGTVYPEDFRPAVPMSALRRAEDAFVDELYACGPRHGATLIAARFPRSYVDPNRSLLDVDGDVLVVSQFTLFADIRRGRRPGFTDAASPALAKVLWLRVAAGLEVEGVQRVELGEFGAGMDVELVNDGPFTIWLDTADRGAPA